MYYKLVLLFAIERAFVASIRCETVERGDKQIFTSASSGDCEYCCRKLKRMAYDGNVKTAALKK